MLARGRMHEQGRAATPRAATRRTCATFYRHFDAGALRDALRRMYLIRRFEEGAEDAYMRGLIHGTMHLSIGQEASAVGACMVCARPTTSPRPIAATAIASPRAPIPQLMFAEFFGKEDGYCRGRGGSMHIADVESGNLGANGIVGGGLPIAVGAALAIKKQKRDDVAVCFFGDGATNEGAFHEALNMAAIWKLPVVFVCENNKYGMSVSTERSMAVRACRRPRRAYRMPGVVVDGNDIADVAEAVMRGDRARARRRGPDAHRMQDLSHPRPFQERPQPLSHQGRDRGMAARATRSAISRPSSIAHGLLDRGRGRGDSRRTPRPRSPTAIEFAEGEHRSLDPPRSRATSIPV